MASDMKKPMGITVLRKQEVPVKLWPLPIEDMRGIGKKTAPQMKALGIKTIGDLAAADPEQLRPCLLYTSFNAGIENNLYPAGRYSDRHL